MATAFFSIGSNEGNRKRLLCQAIRALRRRVGDELACSATIETAPWGYISEAEYLNQAIIIRTSLTPQGVLERTQRIERDLGRRHRREGYEDRPIDIDLLLYFDDDENPVVIGYDEADPAAQLQQISEMARNQQVPPRPKLQVPHPLMHLRQFVLEPLSEIAPHTVHPILNKSIERLYIELQREAGEKA